MRAYLSLLRIRFISELQYKTAALAGIATQFFFGFVFIMVYIAFYESGSGNAPMTLNQLVTYLWLNQAFFALINLWTKDKSLLSMIRDGNVAYELCRPQNLYFTWFIKIYCSKLVNVLLRFLPIILVSIFLPEPFKLYLPGSIYSFIAFVFTLFLSSLLISAIITLFHIIAFFTIDIGGIIDILRVLVEIFAGQLVPILFLPTFLRNLSNYLPFRYINDVPFRLYMESIPIKEALPNIAIQFLWFVLFVIIGYILSKIALKKVVVQGG